jgi:Protein of unknown function DUF2617
MDVDFARPDVARLVFRLFSRELHPELINVYASAAIKSNDYEAKLQICDAGHVITFCRNGQMLCEVMTGREHPLPKRRRILSHGVQGHRCESLQLADGVNYHVSFQLEKLEPDVFLHFHEELLADCSKAELAHRFDAAGRLAPTPLSFMETEATAEHLIVHAFHTFPDNYGVVKTQSMFELR